MKKFLKVLPLILLIIVFSCSDAGNDSSDVTTDDNPTEDTSTNDSTSDETASDDSSTDDSTNDDTSDDSTTDNSTDDGDDSSDTSNSGTLTITYSGDGSWETGGGTNNGALIAAVFDEGVETSAGPPLAMGTSDIDENGVATIKVKTVDSDGNPTTTDWKGSNGTTYDVYILVDIDDNNGPSFGSSGDYFYSTFDPSVQYTQDGDETIATLQTDYQQISNETTNGTLTVTYSGDGSWETGGGTNNGALIAAVFDEGVDPSDGSPLAMGTSAIDENGAATVKAKTIDNDGNITTTDWKGSNGTTYDVYLFVDIDANYDPSFGSSGDYFYKTFDPSVQYTQNGDETIATLQTDYQQISNETTNDTLTVTYSGDGSWETGGGTNNGALIAAVFDEGVDPSAGSPLAMGTSAIDENGVASITAKTVDSDGNPTNTDWEGDDGTTYDVYIFIDFDNDNSPTFGDPGDYFYSTFDPSAQYTKNGDETIATVQNDFQLITR